MRPVASSGSGTSVALSGSAARRYAEAIYDLASGEREIDAFRASLDALAAALGPDALRSLRDPGVPLERRLAAVDAATKGQPQAIGSLLRLLEQRDRIGLLPDVGRAFGELVDRRRGIEKAKITTAIPLDEDQQRAFVARLEQSSGRKLRATFAVDPTIIGGARVQLGDHLLDTSVRGQLDQLRTQLSGS